MLGFLHWFQGCEFGVSCLHSRDFNDWAFSPIPSGCFLSPSLLPSFVWFPLLIGMWAPNPCLRVWFPLSHLTARSWKLRVISFAITCNFFQCLVLLMFLCWVNLGPLKWDSLSPKGKANPVTPVPSSLQCRAEAAAFEPQFAFDWSRSRNANSPLCKCLILWFYLNSGLWVFLDFTLSSKAPDFS